jgi:hypothetical protein
VTFSGRINIIGHALSPGNIYTNSSTGIGVYFTDFAYDNTVNGDVDVQGYRTGIKMRGGDNVVEGTAHCWTKPYQGYMTTAYDLGGSQWHFERIIVDTPLGPVGSPTYGLLISGVGSVNEVVAMN